MIDHNDDPIASALHIPCDAEIARLEAALAEKTAECDRWIARVKWLEHLLERFRELLR
jgi:hypothetical protein